MGAKFLKHHAEELDGSRGAWRPTLQAKQWDMNGDPVAWDEGVVVSCPSCGTQFGVGFDVGGPKIVDGKTDRVVRCQNPKCSWTSEIELDKHQDAVGREHFAKKKAEAAIEVAEGRVRRVKKLIQADMSQRLDEMALAEAKKIIPDGDPDADKKLAAYMKTAKKIG